MTRAHLVERVHENTGYSMKECARIVELALEIIKESLERGENVKISGFGSFAVRNKEARRGRNPQTGEELEITPRKVVSFKASTVLKKKMNSGV